MKNLNLILFIILSFLSINTYATSCEQDVDSMRAEISRSGSISLPNEYVHFDEIGTPWHGSNNNCHAEGKYVRKHQCYLIWDKGNWGTTFHCDR